MRLSEEVKQIFCEVAELTEIPAGAYNFRVNGKSVGRQSSENIDIKPKTDVSGLEIYIKANTKNETVHIPVAISVTGIEEDVYNDFHIGDNSDVTIVAGCGIYNCGGENSVHNGIHRFFIGKNCKVKYIERHLGLGRGAGGKILNPTTELEVGENSEATLYMEQLKGVDSTIRITKANLAKDAHIVVEERLLTHGRQTAESVYQIELGEDSTADINSRAVARDISRQKFASCIVGNGRCRGHSACDAILMEDASVLAEPALDAKSPDAALIHEAAIGKIAGDEIIKLCSLGLTEQEAESKIINGFLK